MLLSGRGVDRASLSRWALWMWVALFGFVGAWQARAESLPENVSADSHAWLQSHMPRALPRLIQSTYGALDRKHIHVVDGLGDWGAGRAKGRHQGTDFVLDLPHRAGSERLRVGSLINGKVAHVKTNWGAYGTTVFVYRDESPKMVYIYAHLDSALVKEGDHLKEGQALGVFGCTGNCRGLKGAHLKHQVHVEVYALPEKFKVSDVNWEHGPLGQLRKLAVHTHRNHGVDLSHYFGSFKLTPVTRDELEELYNKNKEEGGLKVYLDQQKKRRGAKKAAKKAAEK
jgi:murein DD-endopeptidase MepM/ murein hydrolase activator NlpD